MSADAEEPGDKAGEPKPPKIKAEDNPWYLLATLYDTHSIRKPAENRRAWNRYFAASLDSETRAKLIAEKRHSADELTPFSPEELQEIKTLFEVRSKVSTKNIRRPESDSSIHFDNVQFDKPITFEGYLFRDCSFEGAVFSSEVNAFFNKSTFSKRISFKSATFYGDAYFNGASFAECVSPAREKNFSGARFKRRAIFDGATFSSEVYFDGATFLDETRFIRASFSALADFVDATFSGSTYFNGATFSWVKFDGNVRFDKDVNFDGATFAGEANFSNAIFAAQSTFVNAKIKFDTSFKGVTFKTKPPKFFGAELHQGTVWPGRKAWPIPKRKDEAEDFIRAYACLKLEMNRLQTHEVELDFFALELQSRRVERGRLCGLPITIYWLLSDYGRSYAWPFLWLLAVVIAGSGAFFWSSNTLGSWQTLLFSAANTLSVFGLRKDFFDSDFVKCLPAWLDVISAIQTTVGAILLFLVGLGIRNKFRMK